MTGGWTDVGAVEDIPRLGSRVAVVDGENIAIFRTADDEIFALEDRCPHKGGPLSQGIVHGKRVTCPLHNWMIELKSGEAVAPDKGCSRSLPVHVDGGRVFLWCKTGPTHTTCPYCGVGCGVVTDRKGAISGDKSHPANAGRLCSKGAALAESLDDGARLLHPQVNGKAATWEMALDTVASRFAETIAKHGPDSVAFYVSGQLLTEDYYVANKLMKGFIGSANIDTNSRLCMASAVAGHIRAFGADVVPGLYEDCDLADLIVLVGSNAAWCHPVLFQRIAAAKAARGTRIVVIDPRRTAACEIADLHLALAPGSDVALFNGLLSHLAARGRIDRTWTERHTEGLTAALGTAFAETATIAQVAAATGLDPKDIAAFYNGFAATERTVTLFSQGVNQSSSGTDKVNAILNCHLATGRIGRPGMGPLSLTGQPNAMGGREVGGLATQLAAHMSFDDPTDLDRVRRFWRAPRLAAKPGLKAVDMFEAVGDGRIKAIWIMATNPAASLPRAGHVRAALAACPFVVVSDCWPTDTTVHAHVVLPAAGWGEKEGTVTNSERCISRQRAFRPTPGEGRADWWIMTEVARRMGWGDAFSYRTPADVFREHAALSAFENDGRRLFDLGALATLSDAAYASLPPTYWPARVGSASGAPQRLFADGRFPRESGRARLVAVTSQPLAQVSSAAYPFVLNTGRLRDQWHTMTRTGRVAKLMAHSSEPFVALAPTDAHRLGLTAGDLVKLETEHGHAVLRAKPDTGQPAGQLFAAFHWNDQFAPTACIARLVDGTPDPISGQPELKATPARMTLLPTRWRGWLVTRDGAAPQGTFYWARTPVGNGAAFELAGWTPLPTGTARADFLAGLLGTAVTPVVAHKSERLMAIEDGVLNAFLVISDSEDAGWPDRTAVIALLGTPIDGERTRRVLLGAAGEGSCPADALCSCFGVSRAIIREAVTKKHLRTTAEIGVAVRAGTRCGSCLPELFRVLEEFRAAV